LTIQLPRAPRALVTACSGGCQLVLEVQLLH
jgi:hypothetical protein